MADLQWAVAHQEPNDPSNPGAGYIMVVLEQQSAVAAREVFANQVRVARQLSYRSVELRHGGDVVERWPAVE